MQIFIFHAFHILANSFCLIFHVFFCENPTICTDCTLCFPLFSHSSRLHENCQNVLHPFLVFHLLRRFVAYTFNWFRVTISMLSMKLYSFTTLFRIHGNPGKVSVAFIPPNFHGNLQIFHAFPARADITA